jgi:hypothetical protein
MFCKSTGFYNTKKKKCKPKVATAQSSGLRASSKEQKEKKRKNIKPLTESL